MSNKNNSVCKMHKLVIFSSVYQILLLVTYVNTYVLIAANIDDFKTMAKKIVPDEFANQLANLASQKSLKPLLDVGRKRVDTVQSEIIEDKSDVSEDESVHQEEVKKTRFSIQNQGVNIDEIVEKVKERLEKDMKNNNNQLYAVTTGSSMYLGQSEPGGHVNEGRNLDIQSKLEIYHNAPHQNKKYENQQLKHGKFESEQVNDENSQQQGYENDDQQPKYEGIALNQEEYDSQPQNEGNNDNQQTRYEEKQPEREKYDSQPQHEENNDNQRPRYEEMPPEHEKYESQQQNNDNQQPRYEESSAKDGKYDSQQQKNEEGDNQQQHYEDDQSKYQPNQNEQAELKRYKEGRYNGNQNQHPKEYNDDSEEKQPEREIQMQQPKQDDQNQQLQYYENAQPQIEMAPNEPPTHNFYEKKQLKQAFLVNGQKIKKKKNKFPNYDERNDNIKVENSEDVENKDLFSQVSLVKKHDSYEDYVTPEKDEPYDDVNATPSLQVKADNTIIKLVSADKDVIPNAQRNKENFKETQNDEAEKARTENLFYEDIATEQTKRGIKNTMIPTKRYFKFSSPNYYIKLTTQADKYDFNEPLPEKDREKENMKHFPNPPAHINGKARLKI